MQVLDKICLNARMTKVHRTIRLDSEIHTQIERIAKAQNLPFNVVLEELLLQALSEQESELAASFLIPKVQDTVQAAMQVHVDRLAKLLARTAVESTIGAHLTLLQFQMMDPRYTPEELRKLRNQTWEQAHLSLQRRNKDAEQVLALLDEEGARGG